MLYVIIWGEKRLYNNDITYQNVGTSSTRTSALISEFDITNKSTSANLLSTSYGYNALGNITSFVSQAGTKATYTATYSYDYQDQLTSEVISGSDGSSTTYEYAYDTNGNIRSITPGSGTSITLNYTTSGWVDRLTSVKLSTDSSATFFLASSRP